MYKLMTIDVWDTLLRRDCHPDCSKRYSALFLCLKFNQFLKEDFRDPIKIFRHRCLVEKNLSQENEGAEYKIFDVFSCLLKDIINNITNINIDSIVNLLINVEFSFEKKHTYVDPNIVATIKKYSAEKILFLSDFYMSKGLVLELLNYHGISDLVSDGIVSCDVGKNKYSGKLFDYVINIYFHENQKNSTLNWIHIGDNIKSDVEIPSSLGINCVHFLPEVENNNRKNKELLFDINNLNDYIVHNIEILNGTRNSSFYLGVKLAPIFIGYILFIAEQCCIEDFQKLFFFTREGEFFIQIWNELFKDKYYLNTALPSAEVLEVSRLSTFLASLRSVSINEMMRMWSQYSSQSFSTMLKSLNLSIDGFSIFCERYKIDIHALVKYPWKDSRFINLFKDHEFRKIICENILSSRSLLDSYLFEHGFHSSLRRVGLVDIGWRGTIQDNLSVLRPNTRISGMYLGLFKFLNDQFVNNSKVAYISNGNNSDENQDLLKDLSMFEMVCNSPNGSTIGYKRSEGRFLAIRDVDKQENQAFFDFTKDFQLGVLEAAKIWCNYIEKYAISSSSLKSLAVETWRSILLDPPSNIIQAREGLHHNETFGVGAFVNQHFNNKTEHKTKKRKLKIFRFSFRHK